MNNTNTNFIRKLLPSEFDILHNQKQYLPNNFIQEDIKLPITDVTIKKGSRIKILIDKHGKAYNNIRLILPIKYDNIDDINLDDIFCNIQFESGILIDQLHGHNLTMLLKMKKLSCTIFNNTIIVPLPFDILSENNVFRHDISYNNDQYLYIEFGYKYDIGSNCDLLITYYNYDNMSTEPKNIINKYVQNFPSMEHAHIYSTISNHCIKEQYNCNNLNSYALNLRNNNVNSLMFTFFDENKHMLKNYQFDSITLMFNDNEIMHNSQISVLNKTIQKFGSFYGFYYMELGNILDNNLLVTLLIEPNDPNGNAKFIDIMTIGYDVLLCYDGRYGKKFY